MFYHARITYASEWGDIVCNLKRGELIRTVVSPFIHGQVAELMIRQRLQFVNMKAVPTLTLYQTDTALPDQLDFFDQHKEALKNCTEEIIREARKARVPPAVSSLLEKAFADVKPQAFVIMKFNDSVMNSAYEGVIEPTFESFGIKSLRIDQKEDSGRINEQVLNGIAESCVVFADLTGERPNCYYETGFAHALGKELILSIHDGHEIHFDLKANRFIVWDQESKLRQLLRARLTSMKNDGLLPAAHGS